MESKSSPPRHEAAGFFMVRTPLLSADHLVTWAVGLEAPVLASSDPALPAALVRDRAVVRARLASVVERADVREALFVASPSLEDGLGQWFEDPESDSGQKVERAVVRYLQRMASRPTPFGLFAGVALGSFGASTRLRVGERDTHRRHTRLDLDYLVRLAQAFAEDPALRMQLRVRPNSSLAKVAGRLRYVEGKATPTGRVYQLVAVKSSAYLLQTLARARDGAPAAALAEALLVDLPEVSAAEAERFIAQLLDAQVLVFDLAPAITGPEPAVAIAEALAAIEGGRGAAQALGSVQHALETLDACPPGQPASQYRAIARTLDALPARAALDRLFQVDLNVGMTAAQLGAQPLRALERGIALLQRITPTSRDPDLARFTERFMQRFEDRCVPLALALDEDMGIGFGETPPGAADATPLLEGLAFPHAEKPSSGLLARHTYLLARLADVARAGTQILDLTEHDVRALEVEEARRARIPDSFAAVVVLAAASPDALAADDFQLHLRYTAYGPSGANMLGRYCHLLPALPALLMNYLREEEALRPDAIFAEIVHLPESRIGNVILRPVLRDFEIPYLGRSGAPPDRQISVEDLVVSIERGRIVLRSVQHGREVIPRLATAHNHFDPRNLATYRFLSALQRQDVVPVLTWSWGPLRDTQPFLPRVTAGNLVLSAARWRLLAHQLEPFQRGGATERYRHARMLQAQLALPRLVALEESDNLLPVDLDNPLSVEAFAHLVKARASIVLVELRPDPSELCVDGPGGRFAHELVIPFTRRAPPRVSPALSGSRTAAVRRSFPPGSAWLYAKLFTGAGAADDVLREIVTPLVHEVMEAGAVERWFFLRFGDPAWHLRLRLFGEPHRLMSDVLPALQHACEPALEAGSVWRLQLDTYEREVARYGGDVGIALAEEVFYADSEAVLSLIHELSPDTGARARWMLTLLGMDRMLGDLGFDLAARLALCRDLRAGFAREFLTAEDKVFERSLGARYRTERIELEALLEGRGDPALIAAADEAFGQRSRQLAPTIAALVAADAAGALATPLTELAGSFLHLHANRLLRASHRQQELVLADYLCRLYESRLARIR